MRFGEFIGVVSGNPRRIRLRFGPHGNLDEIHFLQSLGHGRQRCRVNHVFRIVQDDSGKTQADACLVLAERGIDAVKAICLGRRAGSVMNDKAQAGIALPSGGGGGNRRRIVAVTADIEPQLPLRPDAKGVGDHHPDHFGFLPGRHHHGNRARQIALVIGNGSDLARSAGQPRRQPPPYPDKVDRQFVERAEDEPERCEQQQFVLDDLQQAHGMVHAFHRKFHYPAAPRCAVPCGRMLRALRTPCNGSEIWRCRPA